MTKIVPLWAKCHCAARQFAYAIEPSPQPTVRQAFAEKRLAALPGYLQQS